MKPDVVQLVRTRYTTKHYDPQKRIPEEDLSKLLEVLRLSPTAVNIQPWHFFIAGTREAKEKILPAIDDYNRARVMDSSHTIVFTVQAGADEEYLARLLEQEVADGRFNAEEAKQGVDAGRRGKVKKESVTPERYYSWAARQAYIALGFILYAAAELGIDSTCLEGMNNDKMDEILGLREKGLRTALSLALGYRKLDDSNLFRPKSRWPAEEIFTVL